MKPTTLILTLLALAAPIAAACSKSKGDGKPAASAMGGSCHNPERGLCFQYPKKELDDEAGEADICDNDPGATWRSGEGCPLANVAIECQWTMGPFVKEQRMFLYHNNPDAKTRDQALGFCSELGYIPVQPVNK